MVEIPGQRCQPPVRHRRHRSIEVATAATCCDEKPHEHTQGSYEHQPSSRCQLLALLDHVGADSLGIELLPASASSRLDECGSQWTIVGECPLRGATVLLHPEVELSHELQHR